MPDDEPKALTIEPSHGREREVISEKERTLLMMMQKIEGESDVELTESHVSEILDQRGKINGYIHEERMQEHERYKLKTQESRFYFGWILLFLGVLILVILWKAPQYTSQVLSGVFGLLSGVGIGIGYKTKKEE